MQYIHSHLVPVVHKLNQNKPNNQSNQFLSLSLYISLFLTPLTQKLLPPLHGIVVSLPSGSLGTGAGHSALVPVYIVKDYIMYILHYQQITGYTEIEILVIN